MKRLLLAAVLSLFVSSPLLAQPKVLVSGLSNPESVAVGFGDKVYVSVIGEFGKDGDGAVMVIDKGKAVPFAKGLDDPKGLTFHQKYLFVTDKDRVLRIGPDGTWQVYVSRDQFPSPPQFLNDIVADPETDPKAAILYVSDSGDLKGNGGAVYQILPFGKVRTVVSKKNLPELHTPNGLAMDGKSFLMLLDFAGNLHRVRISDGKSWKVADGFDGGDGLAWDMHGKLFVSSWKHGKVFGSFRPGAKFVPLAAKFESAADLCLSPDAQSLLVPDMKAGTVSSIPAQVPGYEVDVSPLPLKAEVAFPKLKWTGWQPVNEKGQLVELRPIFLTHAGDGSNRVFVPTQTGTIHVFPNDPKAEKTKVFLDISRKVFYIDQENEQGLLGLAFHPDFKKNGEFFVFYSLRQPRLTNVLSRFRVSKDDPDRADPNSEEEILRIKRPFWNHDGGTITFGPDGYLYIGLGDGGAANDPFNHGQNLKTWLGSVLRIDVNRKEGGKNYAVPKDNPFVGRPDAQPEIWCYGIRNVWRIAFDRATGKLWGADVGQNLFEEINILTKGGNFGWKLREAMHPFTAEGHSPRNDLIDPIWEYHHKIGLSVTGGLVYRGKRLPELAGHYVYGDYITGKVWALKYDEGQKRVTANRPIQGQPFPILSFGEDERGEVYFLIASNSGRGIFRFVRAEGKAK